MPLAVTHVLLTIIAVDLYRDYVAKHRKYFTMWTLFIAGIGGLLPDIDIPLFRFLTSIGIDIPLLAHGEIMHTVIFGLVFLIPFAVFWLWKKHRLALLFLVITFGILFHIFLDYLVGGGDINGIMAFYPFSTERFKLFLLGGGSEAFLSNAGLDAAILLLWLLHEERKHKIKDFI
jgi:membrane-bound metal-dependent hydrolase YbcI (DUF457 family)